MNPFKPAWWLPGAHLQTIGAAFLRRKIKLKLFRERIELPDGDFIDVDWINKNQTGPMIIILHGLGGSIKSRYAQGLLRAIAQQGWRAAVMHFRGCSGTPNRLPRCYHSGDTDDVNFLIHQLRQAEPNTPLAMVGFSLGGNVLLKWLGETAAQNPLTAAIAISVPFELHIAAAWMNQGLARFYQWYLLRSLRQNLRAKAEFLELPVSVQELSRLRSFWKFDDKVTAPLHGFLDVHDYYQRASSRQYLANIQVPTLILHAADDPLIPTTVIPESSILPKTIQLEVSANGGHVGFVAGKLPWKPEYWLERRICHFFKKYF